MNECLLNQVGPTLRTSLGLRISDYGARAKSISQFLGLETKSTDDAFMGLHSWKGVWDVLDGCSHIDGSLYFAS